MGNIPGVAKVFAALRDDSMAKRDIATQLHITPEEIEHLVFGLTLTGLTSGSGPGAISGKKRAQLHVVRSPDEER